MAGDENIFVAERRPFRGKGWKVNTDDFLGIFAASVNRELVSACREAEDETFLVLTIMVHRHLRAIPNPAKNRGGGVDGVGRRIEIGWVDG